MLSQALFSLKRANAFPKKFIAAAQACQKKYGVPACVTLAQWALESNYGKAQSGQNNFFGIKWYQGSKFGFKLCKTWEHINGKDVVVMAKFTSFPTVEDCFNYRGAMLTNPNGYYAKALPLRGNWEQYLRAIAPIYATDPQYADKLIEIIKTWQLQGYNLPGT